LGMGEQTTAESEKTAPVGPKLKVETGEAG
jgi:hypothetical protein